MVINPIHGSLPSSGSILAADISDETANVDGLDQKCSGGVYPMPVRLKN
ncbi:hypothetical protein D1AOALGA4SA_3314 [Olavius algarvensis Delta 1 endosymbiont]|nr:hypothetical protein D1AOALGA4SA_3314 [Olavius algarvensis Delta 1 endosymbiont]